MDGVRDGMKNGVRSLASPDPLAGATQHVPSCNCEALAFWNEVPNIKMGLRYQRCCVGSEVAFPAFDCTSSSTVHAVLEAGSALYRPVMIQFSEMVPHSLQERLPH